MTAMHSRVTPLDQAVEAHISSGTAIYAGYGTSASLREVARQFKGKDPEFILIMPALSINAISLVQAGLVRKIITSFAGAGSYPGTAPSPIIQELYRQGKIQLENWSLLSLAQRLMAGALGVPFLPTRSVVGTSMSKENGDTFAEVADPFNPRSRIGVVKALRPDIALIHGWASDPEGFTIVGPSTNFGKDVWGAKASRGGTIVTVEKVVPSAYIRKHAAMVDLPGHLTVSVSEVSYGGHPEAMVPIGLPGFRGYEHDAAYVQDYRRSGGNPAAAAQWLEQWGFLAHDSYLKKLGSARLAALSARHSGAAGRRRPGDAPVTSSERMVIATAREIVSATRASRCPVVLTGVGTPALAAWVAKALLKKDGAAFDLMTGSGFLGYEPQRGIPFLFSEHVVATSRMITEPLDAHGVFGGGAGSRCLSILNAAQVDPCGNLNSTIASDGSYLVGSGGANDAANAPRVIAMLKQSPNCFVGSLPYVSSPGKKVRTVVSTMGIFEKEEGRSELVLVRYFDGIAPDRNSAIELIKANCGWPLKVSRKLAACPKPTAEELKILRSFDPEGALVK